MAHNQAPRRTIGSWEILEVVGSGSFAIVWKARHVTTGTLAAVKEILSDRLNKKLHESLESEIAALQRLKHSNIVGLLDLIKEPGKIYLVLEYCAGGDLAQHLRQRGPLSEASCRYLLRQLAEGLKVLRQHNVIHRDLKPQNLLLSDHGASPTLKIADFGFARSLQPAGLAETLCGSPLYMAPEVLQLHRYDAKADLWSVGTILFELLTGKPPFNGANHLQLIQNIERGDAMLPDHVARNLSAGCRQLLHQLLRRNPVERISFDELFTHRFLMGEAISAATAAASAPPPATAAAIATTGSVPGALPQLQLQPPPPPPPSGTGPVSAPGRGPQQPQSQPYYQRRQTPISQGAVRFVQPTRTTSPLHPAFAIPSAAAAPPATTAAAGTATAGQQLPQGSSSLPTGVDATAAAPCSGADAAVFAAAAPLVLPAASSSLPGLSNPAAGGGGGGGAAVNVGAINVRELTRSPSPRIIAAAAAVESAFGGPNPTAIATTLGRTGAAVATAQLAPAAAVSTVAVTAAAYGGSGSGQYIGVAAESGSGAGDAGGAPAAAASAGSGGALADSLDSDYVVVASCPYPASATTSSRPPLSPRTPHPAMPSCNGGGSGRNCSGGGAAGAGAGAAAAVVARHAPPLVADAATITTAVATGTAGTAAAPHVMTWQQLLSPIAAATLPPSHHLPYAAGSPCDAGAAPALGLAGGGPHPQLHPQDPRAAATAAATTNAANTLTTVTIRVPSAGCAEGDSSDPLLLSRVVGLLLEDARTRCTALLDQEAEVRQIGDTHAAAAGAGDDAGSSFVGTPAAWVGEGGGGGAVLSGHLAEEAAAAVGTLLVACRLLVAALSANTAAAGSHGGREDGGMGSGLECSSSSSSSGSRASGGGSTGLGGDPLDGTLTREVVAATAAVGDAATAEGIAMLGDRKAAGAQSCRYVDEAKIVEARQKQQQAAVGAAAASVATEAVGAPRTDIGTGTGGPSLAVLAALAVHARSLLAALDEHLHGTVARLLLSGGDGLDRPQRTSTLHTPGTAQAASAAASVPPPPPSPPPPPPPPRPPSLPVVPCSLDTLLAAAVHHSRAAAGEELIGNAAGAADKYCRAADLLLFLLAAPPVRQQHNPHHLLQNHQQQPTGCGDEAMLDAIRPPLTPYDRQRLTKYYAAVRLRQSAVLSTMGPAAMAAMSPSLQPPSALHHNHHHYHCHHQQVLAQPYPHNAPRIPSYAVQQNTARTHGLHLQSQEPCLALHQLNPGAHLHACNTPASGTHGSAAAAAAAAAGTTAQAGAGPCGYGRAPGYGAIVF